MASRIIAPSRETKSAGRLKLSWLMVPMPSRGVSRNPATMAPRIPTTMLRKIPCWASVCIMILASHPRIPPRMSHRRIFVPRFLSVCYDERPGVRALPRARHLCLMFTMLTIVPASRGICAILANCVGILRKSCREERRRPQRVLEAVLRVPPPEGGPAPGKHPHTMVVISK